MIPSRPPRIARYLTGIWIRHEPFWNNALPVAQSAAHLIIRRLCRWLTITHLRAPCLGAQARPTLRGVHKLHSSAASCRPVPRPTRPLRWPQCWTGCAASGLSLSARFQISLGALLPRVGGRASTHPHKQLAYADSGPHQQRHGCSELRIAQSLCGLGGGLVLAHGFAFIARSKASMASMASCSPSPRGTRYRKPPQVGLVI